MELATERPSQIRIDLNKLAENFSALRAFCGSAKIMPVLKANAYGHGLIPCARKLEQSGADYFGVAFLEEGMALREAGIKTPILVLGGVSGRQIELFLKNDLTITASSILKLDLIEQAAAALGCKAKIHLKIDTGLERIGVHHYSASKLLEESLTHKNCQIEGVFSHFAESENEDLNFSKLQLERFQECLEFFPKHSLPLPMRHIANSAAILLLPESILDLVRPGALLYGVNPGLSSLGTLKISPVLSLKSEVVYFKVVAPGATVGYGRTWTATKQTRIVTIPLGYGDGYSRGLSNQSEVLIRGKRYPVVGRVSMDQLTVDIGWDEAYNGDQVQLIGFQGEEQIAVEDLAQLLETDPREVLCQLKTRLPRHYVGQAESD